MKQALPDEARKAASSDSFMSSTLFSHYNVAEYSHGQFLEIVPNINDLCNNISIDKLSAYVKIVYQRMLKLLSLNGPIASVRHSTRCHHCICWRIYR